MNCEQSGQVYLRLDRNNEDIINIIGCYIKENEILDSISVEDFLNKKDILKYLNKVHSKPIKDKSVKNFGDCRQSKICDWSHCKVEKICVSLSRKCNCSCVHCDNHIKEESEKIKENYFKVLEKIKGNNLVEIAFTEKGEPLVYKEEIFKYIESLTLNDTKSVMIYSNGTLLDEKDILWLKDFESKTKIKINFIISIDGITKETFEKIRVGASFLKVTRIIKLLNKSGLLIGVNYCVQRDNFQEIEYVFPFFKELGLDKWQIFLLPCNGRDNNETETAEELIYQVLFKEGIVNII